jgi:hypothetical protein
MCFELYISNRVLKALPAFAERRWCALVPLAHVGQGKKAPPSSDGASACSLGVLIPLALRSHSSQIALENLL